MLAVVKEFPSITKPLMWAFVDTYTKEGQHIWSGFKCDTSKQVSAWLGETLKGDRIVDSEEVKFLQAVNGA